MPQTLLLLKSSLNLGFGALMHVLKKNIHLLGSDGTQTEGTIMLLSTRKQPFVKALLKILLIVLS